MARYGPAIKLNSYAPPDVSLMMELHVGHRSIFQNLKDVGFEKEIAVMSAVTS